MKLTVQDVDEASGLLNVDFKSSLFVEKAASRASGAHLPRVSSTASAVWAWESHPMLASSGAATEFPLARRSRRLPFQRPTACGWMASIRTRAAKHSRFASGSG